MKRFFKTTTLLVATIAMAFVLQSCNSVKPVDKSKLEGYWILKSLKGEDAKAVFEGTMPSIQFDFTQNTIAGSGGCNRYNGGFTLNEKNEFSAPRLASTMMACVHGNKESDFFKALGGNSLILSLDNDLLTITQDKTVVLQFQKDAAPAKEGVTAVSAEKLTGKWTLTSIADGDITKLYGEKVPTMEITSDGKVFGNGGCNSYRTTYKLDGNQMTFTPIMSTKMACPNLKGEELYTSMLSTPLQATLNGDKLTLLKAGKVVLEYAKAK